MEVKMNGGVDPIYVVRMMYAHDPKPHSAREIVERMMNMGLVRIIDNVMREEESVIMVNTGEDFGWIPKEYEFVHECSKKEIGDKKESKAHSAEYNTGSNKPHPSGGVHSPNGPF